MAPVMVHATDGLVMEKGIMMVMKDGMMIKMGGMK
jgi:hypothetical protein